MASQAPRVAHELSAVSNEIHPTPH